MCPCQSFSVVVCWAESLIGSVDLLRTIQDFNKIDPFSLCGALSTAKRRRLPQCLRCPNVRCLTTGRNAQTGTATPPTMYTVNPERLCAREISSDEQASASRSPRWRPHRATALATLGRKNELLRLSLSFRSGCSCHQHFGISSFFAPMQWTRTHWNIGLETRPLGSKQTKNATRLLWWGNAHMANQLCHSARLKAWLAKPNLFQYPKQILQVPASVLSGVPLF